MEDTVRVTAKVVKAPREKWLGPDGLVHLVGKGWIDRYTSVEVTLCREFALQHSFRRKLISWLDPPVSCMACIASGE